MSLFNQILSAVSNPEQEGSSNQLASILDTVQQLSGNAQGNSGAIQSAMSIVGNFTRSSLQEQRNQGGEGQVTDIINQFAGNQANPQAVQALFGGSQLDDMIQQISSKTGLDMQQVQGMLPMLVPLVLNFLKTGNNSQGGGGGNPVLNSFLDADGDGDVDMGDLMSQASGFLGR
jgi:hypothetical protein